MTVEEMRASQVPVRGDSKSATNVPLAVAVDQVECAGGCGAGARGPLLSEALPAAGWIRVGGKWLCSICAADPSIVTEVGNSQEEG